MNSQRTLALAVAGLSLSTTHARAEGGEEAKAMNTIVVTATKTAKILADAPASVSVVDAKAIANRDVQSVDEALSELPGVYTTRPGGHEPSVMGTNVLLRGIPDYSRTLVLVDGQTLNDPYIGAVTWEAVPPETVASIEVVPGPFSSLYGGSAMGGVINIITKVPTKRELDAKAGRGTNNFRAESLVYQDRLGDKLGIVVDYAQQRSDGYIKDEVLVKPAAKTPSPVPTASNVTGAIRSTDASGNFGYLVGDKGQNGWRSRNVGAKLYIDLPADTRVNVGASKFWYDSFDRNHYDTYLRDASGNPTAGANLLAPNGKWVIIKEAKFLTGPNSPIKELSRYTAELESKLGPGHLLRATLGYTDMPLYNNYFVLDSTATLANGGPSSRMLRPSHERNANVQDSFPLGEGQYIVTGLSASKRNINTITYQVSDWRNPEAMGPIQNRTSGEDTSYAWYIQDEVTLSEHLSAYLGGRYDRWSTQGVIEQLAPTVKVSDYGARGQSHFSPKLSLVFRADEQTTLRTSIGNAFHAPNLRDTFGWWTPTTGYTYTPNPDLKPETVTAVEIGIEHKFDDGTQLRATIYDNHLKDLIYRTQSDAAMNQSVANAGAARVKGIEGEVRRAVTAGVTVFANYTFNDPRITDNSASTATVGKVMTATPRRTANIGVEGNSGTWNGSLTGHYVGKIYANDQNTDTISKVYGSYDAFFIVNSKLAYKLTPQASASLSVHNLGNRRYYESTRAEGRTYFAELTLHF